MKVFLKLIGILFASFLISCTSKVEDTSIITTKAKANGVTIYFSNVPVIQCVGNSVISGSLTLVKNMESSNFTASFYDQNGNPFDISSSDYNLLVGSGNNSVVDCIKDASNSWAFRLKTSTYSETTYIKVGLRKINTTVYLSPEIPVKVN